MINAVTTCSSLFGRKSSRATFSEKLHQKLVNDQEGNVVISPFAIQSAAAMIMFGTSGSTRKEISRVLQYSSETSSDTIAKRYEFLADVIYYTEGLKIGELLQSQSCNVSFTRYTLQ